MPKKNDPKATKATQKEGHHYSAENIQVLEGLDPVRKRPGMYIGTTGSDGLHHLIWEVVDNSVDEAMAGYATTITVEMLPDNVISIADDGRGIPVDIHPQTKVSALETVLTTLHAGGKFGGGGYKVSGGLHGVGVSVVNALSEWTRAEVSRDGDLYMQEYLRGKPKAKVKKIGKSDHSGTRITFLADNQIFEKVEYDIKLIQEYLRRRAYLTKGIRVNFLDKRDPEKPYYQGFYFEGGLQAFLKNVTRGKKRIQDEIFYVHHTHDNIDVEVAFTYVDDLETKELCFANNIYNPDGGMHLTGFRTALTRTLNTYGRNEKYLKEKDENLTAEDVREGLVTIISIKLVDPQFEGQTKARLGSPEARGATESVVSDALKEFLEKRPSEARRITEKVLLAAKARKAAKAAKETVLRKGALDGLALPGKLADCSSRKPEESELFIVEGDSAGGSAKQGRDRHTQAILPLRGKILNVEKSRLDKILSNQEIRSLVVAIGTAIADEFDISNIRYHKIIIMTDADVDGAHIRTLLLTLFYRYFRPIIEAGYLYIGMPPLYRLQKGKDIRYAYSDGERDKVVAEFSKAKAEKINKKEVISEVKEEEGKITEDNPSEKIAGVSIQRYKGLGEMNPSQLWETTMDPAVRSLKLVSIEEAEEADHLFDILMGDEVGPRRQFIQTHALHVKNLDI
ncbi:MAG: DNA topoisomerase (ATP-hydrolyzing) subunit B [Anaplasmataceae bacterium]|nr:DNA topoisomerase (ATP-hydrolyzing) subunit B [Anaplasmataceae bacterium]